MITQVLCDIIEENAESFPSPEIPQTWVTLGQTIASQRSEKPWMSYSQFVAMATEHGIHGNQEVMSSLKYLQSLGKIFC